MILSSTAGKRLLLSIVSDHHRVSSSSTFVDLGSKTNTKGFFTRVLKSRFHVLWQNWRNVKSSFSRNFVFTRIIWAFKEIFYEQLNWKWWIEPLRKIKNIINEKIEMKNGWILSNTDKIKQIYHAVLVWILNQRS